MSRTYRQTYKTKKGRPESWSAFRKRDGRTKERVYVYYYYYFEVKPEVLNQPKKRLIKDLLKVIDTKTSFWKDAIILHKERFKSLQEVCTPSGDYFKYDLSKYVDVKKQVHTNTYTYTELPPTPIRCNDSWSSERRLHKHKKKLASLEDQLNDLF